MVNIDPSKLSKKIKDFYVLENNTLKSTPKNNPKDKIEVEIGDSKQPDFKPQFKFMRWDNEVNFSLRAQEHPQATIETDKDGKIKYITPEYEVHQYDKPGASEDGGFEFEWVLPSKPVKNVLTSTIQTKGLNFFYQPALTQEEIDEGVNRPENVVGSYAVYHSTKGGMNDAAGMKYKVGKAFHIFRPKVTDANGNETWGELNVDVANGLLTVTIDQKFLDNAVYPVVVDPTFGYTDIGATQASFVSDNLRACTGLSQPGSSGTLDSMTFYTKNVPDTTATCHVRYVLYKSSDKSRVDYSSELTFSDTTLTWRTVSLTGGSVVASTDYDLSIWQKHDNAPTNTVSFNYDATAGFNLNRDNTAYHATNAPPDPYTQNSQVTSRKVSIYATYTASGGAVEAQNRKMTTNPFFWGF